MINSTAKDCPESYRSNSEKEELILTYAENFRRQYHHIYRDRKPLLLRPMNECGIPVLTVVFSIRRFSSSILDRNLSLQVFGQRCCRIQT
jgi:hypothetical protein